MLLSIDVKLCTIIPRTVIKRQVIVNKIILAVHDFEEMTNFLLNQTFN